MPEEPAHRRRTTKKSPLPWLIGGGLAAAVLLMIGCGGVVFFVLGRKTGQDPAPIATHHDVHSRPVTRGEFRQLVIGRTPQEVIDTIGNPDKTSEFGKTRLWTYRRCTIDTVTGKMDSVTTVVFEGGRVSEVQY